MADINYIVRGKWSQCAHCKTLNAGDWDQHYCGAEWQVPPLGPFPDGVDQRWIDAVKEQRRVNSGVGE